MSPLDTTILGLLIKDGRATFADIARDLNVSRAHVRERVNNLIDDGVIEQFTAVVNPEKMGKAVSAFFDVKVSPQGITQVAEDLASQPEVVSLYIMNDMQSSTCTPSLRTWRSSNSSAPTTCSARRRYAVSIVKH